MKTLYVARHAKSSWIDLSKKDFDRPLNNRGKKDAPEIARRLVKRRVHIDGYFTSPALRAKETCRIYFEALKGDPENLFMVDKLYQASYETFYELVRGIDDRFRDVAIFSHNPGITDFVNSLCENVRVDNVPTAGVYAIEIDIKYWKDFKPKVNQYKFFEYPKA